MPNLINVLRRGDDAEGRKMSDKERLERALKEAGLKGGADAAQGMAWGTCMIFSCEKDCCADDNGADARESWREEVVLIQAAI